MVSEILSIPKWRLFYLRIKKSKVQGCVAVKFGIIGNGKYSCFQSGGPCIFFFIYYFYLKVDISFKRFQHNHLLGQLY